MWSEDLVSKGRQGHKKITAPKEYPMIKQVVRGFQSLFSGISRVKRQAKKILFSRLPFDI
jgi:hypothetical protein